MRNWTLHGALNSTKPIGIGVIYGLLSRGSRVQISPGAWTFPLETTAFGLELAGVPVARKAARKCEQMRGMAKTAKGFWSHGGSIKGHDA